jgi:hypothetical protein
MKLKNKKTGEIVDFMILKHAGLSDDGNPVYAPFNGRIEEWKDASGEPKEYYWIDYDGKVKCFEDLYEWQDKMKQIGNHFKTKEEAELAVEKLKALKRLKDKDMRIYSFKKEKTGIDLDFYTLTILAPRDKDSLKLLFGDEE